MYLKEQQEAGGRAKALKKSASPLDAGPNKPTLTSDEASKKIKAVTQRLSRGKKSDKGAQLS